MTANGGVVDGGVALQRLRLVSGADTPRRLGELARELAPHRESIARTWQGLYLSTFESDATLPGPEFLDQALGELGQFFGLLQEEDLDRLSAWFRENGRKLARQGVPLAEVIESLHLFEESVLDHLRHAGKHPPAILAAFVLLDRLSHHRIVALTTAYDDESRSVAAARLAALEDQLANSAGTGEPRSGLVGLLGASAAMQKVYARLQVAARERASVLVTGESGTGKELAARAVHLLAGDPSERFVAVNCAAIPREIFESELFGHRRGSYSGATSDREGLFRAADGGTLFLDEITELSLEGQAKLLRAIQERAIRPVGSNAEIPVDARIVASTNRDPAQALAEGRLRRDLYYRLQTFVVALPPLRQRPGDVSVLARHFCERWKVGHRSRPLSGLTAAALARLERHTWPGNVRELEAAVFSACSTCEGRWVGEDDLPDSILETAAPPRPAESPGVSLKDAERDAITRALVETGRNKTRAAELLGISRKQLHVKIRDYGL